jgi:hypothetical protein
MRDSTLKAGAAALAALGVILCLGTSPVVAMGGGPGGPGGNGGGGVHFDGGGVHPSGGYHRGATSNGGYHAYHPSAGGYNACALTPYNQSINRTYPYSC